MIKAMLLVKIFPTMRFLRQWTFSLTKPSLAYFSAIGIRITELPITPEKIVKGLCSKERFKTDETEQQKGG